MTTIAICFPVAKVTGRAFFADNVNIILLKVCLQQSVFERKTTQSWYLAIFFAMTSSFALYLIRKPPVFETVVRHLTWFIPRRKEEDH